MMSEKWSWLEWHYPCCERVKHECGTYNNNKFEGVDSMS